MVRHTLAFSVYSAKVACLERGDSSSPWEPEKVLRKFQFQSPCTPDLMVFFSFVQVNAFFFWYLFMKLTKKNLPRITKKKKKYQLFIKQNLSCLFSRCLIFSETFLYSILFSYSKGEEGNGKNTLFWLYEPPPRNVSLSTPLSSSHSPCFS